MAATVLSRHLPAARLDEVEHAADFARALGAGRFDVMISEFRLSWSDGAKLLAAVRDSHTEIPVLFFCASAEVQEVVEATPPVEEVTPPPEEPTPRDEPEEPSPHAAELAARGIEALKKLQPARIVVSHRSTPGFPEGRCLTSSGGLSFCYEGGVLMFRAALLPEEDPPDVLPEDMEHLSGADIEALYHEEIYRLTIIDGLTDCSGTCLDTDTDPAHCGSCGQVCGATEP